MLEQYERNKFYFAKSKFRSSFSLDKKDVSYINKKGLNELQQHAKEFITKRLAPAFPYKDGKQTPYRGHPVFKAQHALAFCCRNCLFKWYKIPKGRQLSEEEINNIVKIIMNWIEKQKENYEIKEKILLYGLGMTNKAIITPITNPPAPIIAGSTQPESKLNPETSFNVT